MERKADERPQWWRLSDMVNLHNEVHRLINDIEKAGEHCRQYMRDVLAQSETLLERLEKAELDPTIAKHIQPEVDSTEAYARSRRVLAVVALVALQEGHDKAASLMIQMHQSGELEEWLAAPLRERALRVLEGDRS